MSNSSDSRSSGRRRVALERLHQEGGLAEVAHQDAADEAAVAHDQLLVGAAPGFGELHHLVAFVARLGDAHRGEVDAGDLELVASLVP